MSARPKTIRILGRDYKVYYRDDMGEGFYGLCDPEDCEIDIREGLHPVEEADTVLHEVLHAVHFLMDIGLNPRMEENVVRKTATGLIQVFADNPRLLAYLTEALSPSRRRR